MSKNNPLSGKTAHRYIIKHSLSNIPLLFGGALLCITACKDEEPKIDNPTLFEIELSTSLENMGVKIDTENHTITVPKAFSDEQIKAIFSKVKISDVDASDPSVLGIKAVRIEGEAVIISYTGVDGRDGTHQDLEERYKIIKQDAKFPEILPGSDKNKITVGDKDFFKTLFSTKIKLPNGNEISPTQIFVNNKDAGNIEDLEIKSDHIIHQAGTYIIKIVLHDSSGNEYIKEYTLQVEYKEAVEAPTSGLDSFHRLGFKSKDTGNGPSTGTMERTERGVNNMPNNYFKLLELVNNFSPEMKKEVEDRMRAEPIIFDNVDPLDNLGFDLSEYSCTGGTEAYTHGKEQGLNFKGVNGTSLGYAFNMGKYENGKYAVKALNLNDINHETYALAIIEKLKSLGKASLYINSSFEGDAGESVPPGFVHFANYLASDDCELTVYIMSGNGQNKSMGTTEENRNGTADLATIASVIAEVNPVAFKNIKLMQISGVVAYYTPTLAKILQENGAELIFSPFRRGVVGLTNEGGYGMFDRGYHSMCTPPIAMNDIIGGHIMDALGLDGEVPSTPYVWKKTPYFPGKLPNRGGSTPTAKDGLNAKIRGSFAFPNVIECEEGEQTTFADILPKKLTDVFDKDKLTFALPNGKLIPINQSFDISELRDYDLEKNPIEIGFSSTENDKLTIAPCREFSPKIEIKE